MAERTLDVITLGRSSVDLYGEQVGGPLEMMQSFAKYVGGCPTNIGVGTARLGLKSAVITRVGDEPMGRFIRQTLAAEGVDVSHVSTDPKRLTALVILGIRDSETFPHIFYRENCADMALEEEHIDAAFIASAKAVVVTGTHFSRPNVAAASHAAVRYAVSAGTRVVLDIDYRPVLWGLTGHEAGEERFVANQEVTAGLQSILPDCDLVVGTEEEVHIAGGSTDTRQALRHIRELSSAVIALKRGPLGCVVFTGEIPDDLEQGIKGPGFSVKVFNTLGAGDAFMSGLLRGWLREEPWERCCQYANACGAMVVSRHGCAPAIPSWDEMAQFIEKGSATEPLRLDPTLNHIHHATTRPRHWSEVCALAFDHRSQFEDIADRNGVDRSQITTFKDLLCEAALLAAAGTDNVGVIIDGRYGADALARITGSGVWVARPVEVPGSRPLEFEAGDNVGLDLRNWPQEQIVKCLVYYHPDDEPGLRLDQEDKMMNLYEACRETNHELLLELIPPSEKLSADDTLARSIDNLYVRGIFPDWWKLPPQATAGAWEQITNVIEEYDPYCRGVLLLGLGASEDELQRGFELAAGQPLCKGFAVGRSVFQTAAERWFAGTINDSDVIEQVGEKYSRLVNFWAQRKG
ncbi:MAG: 5-dehydro-2-deoxygluconokinase [Gammaproteobacteria bacterium]|nr:5-dehydro-2-deoxygluconokinase [Gammaproteobacteria bacterium]